MLRQINVKHKVGSDPIAEYTTTDPLPVIGSKIQHEGATYEVVDHIHHVEQTAVEKLTRARTVTVLVESL